MRLFVLAGQSNMSGRARVERGGEFYDFVPIETEDPNIRRFSASGVWECAIDPLHRDVEADGCAPRTVTVHTVVMYTYRCTRSQGRFVSS